MPALFAFAIFIVSVLVGWAAVCREVLAEEIIRQFCRWENTWNHPEHLPWHDAPETRWGPWCPWFCTFADWITRGRCHD